MLARARARDRAPESLRERIEGDRARGRRSTVLPAWLGRRAFAGGVGALVVAAVLVIALALPAGTPGLPSISQAAAEAMRGATQPAPAAASGRILKARIGGISFPNWSSPLGYSAQGVRHSRLGGHPALTVYYERNGEQVAYLILDGRVHWPAVPVQHVGPLEIRALRLDGNAVVTWSHGHDTCLLVSHQLSTAELASLANWTEGGGRLGASHDAGGRLGAARGISYTA
ncbi:MAG TPA: hypothetical protein VKT31_05000 [Solirubrobacteraceae bacterium]|nr:hypothetical protein [Solirubrobacteraceae bacterium]